MVDSTINSLTAGSALVGTEIFEGVVSPFGTGTDRKYTAQQIKNFSQVPRTITAIFSSGAVLTTGVKGDLEVPYACTINSVTMLADHASSTISIDIWKSTFAGFPPTDANSITAAAVPTITASNKSTNSTLTGWTTSLAAGDILRFNIDATPANVTRCTLSLKVTPTGA